MRRKIYIGVAWPYVNDLFHIGHLAGAYLPADIFSRFHKMQGNDVLMISGSDFHGTPITLKARELGANPEKIAQKYHELDKKYLEKFRIEYTLYTSTHTENHREVTQKMFLQMLASGYITRKETEQWYSEKTNEFLQDRYIEGGCPHCECKDARGDQCENCGRSLDPLELVNPVSKVDKSPLVKRVTENYFLDLPKLQDDIFKWLKGRKNMRSWAKNEAEGWLKEGLKERAITRDINYGIPLPVKDIPQEEKIKNIEKKKFYVWFEAVTGYLSGAIEHSKDIGKEDYYKEFFFSRRGETYYFVGQDNLVFHCVNWPAQLLAFNKDINLPRNVFVNKFLTLEREKMSKSRKWLVYADYLAENYPICATRFYLAYNMPQSKEVNFTWRSFVETNNGVLVGTVGNFIHRTLSLAKKYLGDEIEFKGASRDIRRKVDGAFKRSKKNLEVGDFRKAVREVVELCESGNKYIDEKKAWKRLADSPKEGEKILKDLLYIVYALRDLLYPFTPSAAEELYRQLGGEISLGELNWRAKRRVKIKLKKDITPLFSKIDPDKIREEEEKLRGAGHELKSS